VLYLNIRGLWKGPENFFRGPGKSWIFSPVRLGTLSNIFVLWCLYFLLDPQKYL